MSYTEIYRLGRKPMQIGECNNAWRGAMYVWTDIAKRYWHLETFPMLGNDEMRHKIWNTGSHHKLPEHELIVLLSTMDNATVSFGGIRELVDAFAAYANEHPMSSLLDQATILKAADLKKGDLIAWNQTSIGEFWGITYDCKKDRNVWYNPKKGDRHFDVIAEAKSRSL